MLFVGDDCAEDHHDIEVVDEQGRRLARRRLPEGLEGVTRLHALIAGVMPSEWAFGELLRHLVEHNVVELIEGPPRATPRLRCQSTATGRRRSACCARWSSTWLAATARLRCPV